MNIIRMDTAALNNLIVYYDNIHFNLPGYKPELSYIYVHFCHFDTIKKWFENCEPIAIFINKYHNASKVFISGFEIQSNENKTDELFRVEIEFLRCQ